MSVVSCDYSSHLRLIPDLGECFSGHSVPTISCSRSPRNITHLDVSQCQKLCCHTKLASMHTDSEIVASKYCEHAVVVYQPLPKGSAE